MAGEFYFINVIFETDCLQLVQGRNKTSVAGMSYFAGTIQDCKVLNKNKLQFIKRAGNRVANDLTNLAFVVGEKYWIEKVPYQLDLLVASDGVQQPFSSNIE